MDTKKEHRAHAEGSPRGKPCDLSHSPSGRLIGKFRDNSSVTLSATVDMAYGYCNDYQPHAVKRMYDYKNGLHYDLRWDGAGNLGQVSIADKYAMFETGRFLYWTEDNRMHTAIDDRYYSYYAYDNSGERRLKLAGDNKLMDVNADVMLTYTTLDELTLYPSSYMVLTNKGYTKHYYAGTERVAARIGGGCLDVKTIEDNPELQKRANMLFDQSREQILYRKLPENDLDCIVGNELAIDEFKECIKEIPGRVEAEVKIYIESFKEMMRHVADECENEPEVFFYHSDHLGSASWITDFEGMAVQHLQYLPYGERYVDQRVSGYHERFTFTGKERDEETGYGYFGARYMDHELMTMWLSVDPMADKYPSISPYAYCAWNPVKLVDPDGRELTDFYDISTGEHLKHVEDGIDEAVAINRAVFNACEEDNASTSFEKSLGVSLGSNSDFVALAGTLYAESTARESSFEEMAGIGSVIRNRALADDRSPIDVASGSGIYGYKDRNKINDPKANKSKVNLAFKAAMITLCTNTDYSNGAYFWQGNDFRGKGTPANKEYYQKGFDFTDKSHDRFGMGSKSVPGCVPYKYESTAAAAGTVFMRLTDSWMKEHGATKWNGR